MIPGCPTPSHSTAQCRAPVLKRSSNPSLQVARLQAHATTLSDKLSQPPGVLIQRPTGFELMTRGSQAATLSTQPTPGFFRGSSGYAKRVFVFGKKKSLFGGIRDLSKMLTIPQPKLRTSPRDDFQCYYKRSLTKQLSHLYSLTFLP